MQAFAVYDDKLLSILNITRFGNIKIYLDSKKDQTINSWSVALLAGYIQSAQISI